MLTALRAIGPFEVQLLGSCVNIHTLQQQGRPLLSCSFTDVKDKYRVFYMVKGHINTSHATIVQSYDGYFKRLWNNNESYIHEQGFAEAWQQLMEKRT